MRLSTSDFFINLLPPLAAEYPSGAISNFTKLHGDIHNFVFIACVNDTSGKLFIGVKDTGNILSPVS